MPDDSSQAATTRVSPSILFIDRFLSQRAPAELTALLLGQLDTFNRISTTFGIEKSREFCAEYAETLRTMLPQGTPIIRLSDRRFAILVPLESMAGVADTAMAITEEHQPQMQVGEDSFLVDVTFGAGKIIMIGFPVQYRGQTHATFKFLFNSIYYGAASYGSL